MAYIVGPNDELIGVLRTATAPPTAAAASTEASPSTSSQSTSEIRLDGAVALAD